MNDIAAKFRHYRIRSFGIMWLVYAGYYLTRKNYSVAMAGMQESYGFDEIQLGWIMTAFLGMYALGQFTNGVLGDKLGSRIMLSVGMICSAIMSLCFGFSSAFIFLAVVWGINGYMQSSGWSNCVKSMTQWFSQKERGTVMGFYCTCYQIGSVAATIIATYALGRWGWKSAFTVPAFILIAIAVIYILFHKDKPEDVGLPSIDEYHGDIPKSEAKDAKNVIENKGGPSKDVIVRVLTHPMVWFMGLSYFCLKFVRYSLLMWLPFYLIKQLGYEPETSGYMSGLAEVAGFLGAITAGIISDKYFEARRAPICAIMFLGLAVLCALQTKLSLMGAIPMMGGLLAINFMIYGPDSLMTGAGAADIGGREGAATAAGFINGCGSIGSAIQGVLLGYISKNFGYDYFFMIFIPLAIIPFLLMLSQWNTKTKAD